MSNYINKYLKYKNKYLLIKQLAGTEGDTPVNNITTEIYDLLNVHRVDIQLNGSIMEQLNTKFNSNNYVVIYKAMYKQGEHYEEHYAQRKIGDTNSLLENDLKNKNLIKIIDYRDNDNIIYEDKAWLIDIIDNLMLQLSTLPDTFRKECIKLVPVIILFFILKLFTKYTEEKYKLVILDIFEHLINNKNDYWKYNCDSYNLKNLFNSLYYNKYEGILEYDKKFIIFMVKKYFIYYKFFIHESYKTNENFNFLMLESHRYIFTRIHDDIKKTKPVIDILIKNHGLKEYYDRPVKLSILHIGRVCLDTQYTENYINYTFINFDNSSSNFEIVNYINEFKKTIKKDPLVIFIMLNNITTNKDLVKPPLLTTQPQSQLLPPPPPRKYQNDDSTVSTNDDSTVTVFTNDITNDNFKRKIISFYKKLKIEFDDIKEDNSNIKIINYYEIYADEFILSNRNNYNKVLNVGFYNDNTDNNDTERHNSTVLVKILNPTDEYQDNTMLATHWINWQINTPYEFKYRQRQISGTCWLNSIINSFILVPKIKDAIVNKITNSPYSSIELPSLTDLINNDERTFEEIIFIIMRRIFHTDTDINVKPVLNDGDYILMLAAYIKSIYHKQEFTDLLQKNSIIDDDKQVYKFCSATLENELRKKLCASPRSNSEDLKKLNELCWYIDPESICKTYTDIYKNKGYILGIGGYPFMWDMFIKPLFGVINYETPYMSFTITDTETIYIYNYNLFKIHNFLLKQITLNKISYIICSAVIDVSEDEFSTDKFNHSICGIITTSDVYLLYDSNARNISITEDWSVLLDGNAHKLPKLNEAKQKNVNYKINYIVYQKIVT